MSDISNIWQFELRKGNSPDPREGACLLDVVSWLEYGELGDRPPCVCPVIAAFGRGINDAMSDAGRQRLRVYIPRLVGTVDPESETPRAIYLAWQTIRVFAPLALDFAGRHADADRLRHFEGTLSEAAETAWAAASISSRRMRKDEAWTALGAARAAWAAAEAAEEAAAEAAEEAAAEAAEAAAAATAETHSAAVVQAVEDAMIATLEGVLAIGRQAEPILPERFSEAVRLFEMARQ